MATQNTINLIRTKTGESPQLDAIESSLRKSGYIGLISFVSIGLLIGVLYLLFSLEVQNLETQKIEFVRRVDSYRQVEGYYRSIKDRTKIVEKTMNSKRPWSQLLDQVSLFATPPLLTAITVDDQNKIVMTISAGSIDAIVPVVNGIIEQAREDHIINPKLSSFQIAKNGNVIASFSFSAVF